jgi:ABC-type Fe3+-hydroxamate transport system substrate-binding protein
MSLVRILTVAPAIAVSFALLASPSQAQSNSQSNSQAQSKRTASQAKPQAEAKPAVPAQVATVQPKCLRALDGTCTDPSVVEAVRLRAEVVPAVRVSYFGTPAGTIGGAYIPFERLFQDNPVLFGLPTFTFFQTCCTSRTK